MTGPMHLATCEHETTAECYCPPCASCGAPPDYAEAFDAVHALMVSTEKRADAVWVEGKAELFSREALKQRRLKEKALSRIEMLLCVMKRASIECDKERES